MRHVIVSDYVVQGGSSGWTSVGQFEFEHLAEWALRALQDEQREFEARHLPKQRGKMTYAILPRFDFTPLAAYCPALDEPEWQHFDRITGAQP